MREIRSGLSWGQRRNTDQEIQEANDCVALTFLTKEYSLSFSHLDVQDPGFMESTATVEIVQVCPKSFSAISKSQM
jgi:hypothetical protein